MNVGAQPIQLPPVPSGYQHTLINAGSFTVYYGDVNVSPTHAVGSIAAGVTVQVTSPYYVVCPSGPGQLEDIIVPISPITTAPYVQPQPAPYFSPSEVLITAFQSGYSVSSGTGTLTLLDTAVPGFLQAGALKCVTPNDNSITNVRNSVSLGGANFANKTMKVLLWISDIANVQDCLIYLGSDALGTYTNFVTFAPPASGSTYKPIQSGEWVWMTFSTAVPSSTTGTPVMSAINNIQLRFTSKNNVPVTFRMGGITLENQPANGYVSICFDDCWLSQYTVAAGLIDPYRYPVTAAVIASLIDTVNLNNQVNSSYMSLQQMQALRDYHNWEFGCHANTVAAHNAGFDTLSNDGLTAQIVGIKQWLQQNGFGLLADYLALPLGAYTLAQLPVYKQFFRAVRTLGQIQINSGRETFPPYDWNRLRCISINAASANTNPATVNPWITGAVSSKEWLILLFHDVVASGATGSQINTTDFSGILSNIQASGATVKSVGDMMRMAAV